MPVFLHFDILTSSVDWNETVSMGHIPWGKDNLLIHPISLPDWCMVDKKGVISPPTPTPPTPGILQGRKWDNPNWDNYLGCNAMLGLICPGLHSRPRLCLHGLYGQWCHILQLLKEMVSIWQDEQFVALLPFYVGSPTCAHWELHGSCRVGSKNSQTVRVSWGWFAEKS